MSDNFTETQMNDTRGIGGSGSSDLVMCDKSPEFYKKFYADNRIKLLLYDNLRKHFNKMIDEVLGPDYYNMGMDVYECDRISCEDITIKAKSFLRRLFST